MSAEVTPAALPTPAPPPAPSACTLTPSLRNAGAVNATDTTVDAAPIPYRTGGVVSGGEVAGMAATTLGLLVTLALAAWYARRRGWLDRWASAPAASAATAAKLRVLERVRLSRRTSVFRLVDGEREFLILESDAGATSTLLSGSIGAATT